MGVCAVVVTHNRRELLAECLGAIAAQTRPPARVVVVDNASADGTRTMVETSFPAVELLVLGTNTGAAGGFHAGVLAAARGDQDWLWLMDDDTIPETDALERLLARTATPGLPSPSLLVSRVVWTDGRLHPMNQPEPSMADMDVFMAAVERGLVPVRGATFPSLLVSRAAVERHGPPRPGFFVWADDIDFTQRILRREPGYLVPDSIAVHKTATAHRPWEGGQRFYYAVRNGVFILRGDTLDRREKVRWLLLVASQVQRFLTVEGVRPWTVRVVLRGLRDGIIRPHPSL